MAAPVPGVGGDRAPVRGRHRRRAHGPVLAPVANLQRDHRLGRIPTVGVRPGLFVIRRAGNRSGHRLRLSRPRPVGPAVDQSHEQASRRRTTRAGPRRTPHLPEMAEALAAMAIGLAAICWYWAAGGSFGLSTTSPHPTWALLAAGVTGAAVAAVGLLGLAGRWGPRTPFWLPVALTWLGSGAVAASTDSTNSSSSSGSAAPTALESDRNRCGAQGDHRAVGRCCRHPRSRPPRRTSKASDSTDANRERGGQTGTQSVEASIQLMHGSLRKIASVRVSAPRPTHAAS